MDPRAGFPDPATVQGEEAGNDLDGGGMGDSGDGDLSCARERARSERGGKKKQRRRRTGSAREDLGSATRPACSAVLVTGGVTAGREEEGIGALPI